MVLTIHPTGREKKVAKYFATNWLKKALQSPDFLEEERDAARLCLRLYEEGKLYRDE